jgi:hypothetical protein
LTAGHGLLAPASSGARMTSERLTTAEHAAVRGPRDYEPVEVPEGSVLRLTGMTSPDTSPPDSTRVVRDVVVQPVAAEKANAAAATRSRCGVGVQRRATWVLCETIDPRGGPRRFVDAPS